MITRENFNDIVRAIEPKDKDRIRNSIKEYCVIRLHIFNAGSYVEIKLTDDFIRHQYESKKGNCIVETFEVQSLLIKKN